MASFERHRTAIGRSALSRPIRFAIESGLISNDTTVFDYGCGRGDDLRHLESLEIRVSGWDPVHRSSGKRIPADVVNLGYVVNVIENPIERQDVLTAAWQLAKRVLIVAARLTMDADATGKAFEDGVVTRLNTFQKYFTQSELRSWIDQSLGSQSVAVAPGVFFVFRDAALQETYLAARYIRRHKAPTQRHSDVLFEQHRALLAPLIEFMSARGRLPAAEELPETTSLVSVFGSTRKAFAIVRRVTGPEQWDTIRVSRYQDLLVRFALARFRGRPRLSDLPLDQQLDVREFFSTYTKACALSDRLLFSAGKPTLIEEAMRLGKIGKLTGNALYVHVDTLPHLPPVLRVFEGCARSYVGHVDRANVIKLHRGEPKVSYLCYPGFDTDPHPTLVGSLLVPFQSLDIDYRDYSESANPPILHRKEEFLASDDIRRKRFAQLTKQEERLGLFANPETIGTRDGWSGALREAGYRLSGHRVVRLK